MMTQLNSKKKQKICLQNSQECLESAYLLKETLSKMEERVGEANWDSDTDPYMIKKLKEQAIKDQ